MNLKKAAYEACMQLVSGHIAALRQQLDDLRDSIAGDTKSTAGDKHETARAHLQIAQEQVGRQLAEALGRKQVLDTIAIGQVSVAVVKGSLVRTSAGYFFLSIPAGKIIVEGIPVIALSPQSPLGARLMGLHVGEAVVYNGNRFILEAVF